MTGVVSQQTLLGGQSDWCKTGTRHRVTTEDKFRENDSRFLCLLESFKTADSAARSHTHFTCIGVFVQVCMQMCVSLYVHLFPFILLWFGFDLQLKFVLLLSYSLIAMYTFYSITCWIYVLTPLCWYLLVRCHGHKHTYHLSFIKESDFCHFQDVLTLFTLKGIQEHRRHIL